MATKSGILISFLAAATFALAPPSFAQKKVLSIGKLEQGVSVRGATNQLKAATGDSELKCSGSPGSIKCVSDYAWVCPDGWSPCAARKGGTCCKQG